MTKGQRPVDVAMGALRPEKNAVRTRWLAKIKELHMRFPCIVPLYLTLAGAEGHDIEMLIDAGVLIRAENGAILDPDGSAIAVESSPEAVFQLQSKFPGLKIIEKNIKDLIRGPRPIRWPDAHDARCCRAMVINLDLNEIFESSDGTTFPLIEVIDKFVVLHEETPAVKKWSLLLTVHAELPWRGDSLLRIFEFLKENFEREARFSTDCRTFLGEEIHSKIMSGDISGLSLNREEQQKLLMVLVPKKIAAAVHGRGWDIQIDENIRYGNDSSAPMATWIVDFNWNPSGRATPDKLYRSALKTVLAKAGHLDARGGFRMDM